MNLAFNRKRDVQTIAPVRHPERNQEFRPGYEKLRQPKDTRLELFDLAHLFSVYKVDDGMIDELEALMVAASPTICSTFEWRPSLTRKANRLRCHDYRMGIGVRSRLAIRPGVA